MIPHNRNSFPLTFLTKPQGLLRTPETPMDYVDSIIGRDPVRLHVARLTLTTEWWLNSAGHDAQKHPEYSLNFAGLAAQFGRHMHRALLKKGLDGLIFV